MFVKICGTTNLEDALLAVEAGADAVGFVFAPSKRQITPEQVAAITRELPGTVEKVGVFTDPDPTAIGAAVATAGLTAVQMHWEYDFGRVLELRRAVGPEPLLWQLAGYQVEPPEAGMHLAEHFGRGLLPVLMDREVDAVLLDAVKGKSSGGLGKPFPWSVAANELRAAHKKTEAWLERRRRTAVPVFLAGGLTPENVQEAIAALGPVGVDVVSGVEAGPGTKDPDRLREFVRKAKRKNEWPRP